MLLRELYTTFIFEGPADVVKSLRANYPDPNQIDLINKNYEWIKQTFPKGAEWYMLLIGAQLSGDQNKLQQRLGQYNFTSFEKLQQDLAHFSTLDYQPIKDYAFNNKPVKQVFDELTTLENTWKKLPSRPVKPQEGDWVLKDFGNGIQWWFVNRGYCKEEGRSGKHCGNVVGQTNTNERILSLRHKMKVLLTFILLPNGWLGEMKATGNQKPDPKYHPYIMYLLLSGNIKGIKGAGWGPEFNFSIFDLDDDNLTQIIQQRPSFINNQITATPREILKAPDIIKNNPIYQQLAIDELPILENFFVNGKVDNSDKAWERVIAINPRYIVYAPNTLSNYRERIIAILSKHTKMLLETPRSVLKDRSIMEDVIRENPASIKYMVPAILTYDLCKFAVSLDSSVLSHVPEDKRSLEIYKIALKSNGSSLSEIPEEERTEELCEIAIKQDGGSLYWVPNHLRTPKLLMIAFKSNPSSAIQYMPDELKTSEMYATLIKHDPIGAFRYIPDELKTPDLYKAAVTKNGSMLRIVPEELRTPELCLIAVKQNGNALEYVPSELRTPKICKLAVTQAGYALSDIPLELRTPELCLIAVKQNGSALDFVPEELRTLEICKIAVKQIGTSIRDVPEQFLNDDMYKVLLNNSGSWLYLVPEENRTLNLCKIAVTNNGEALRFIPDNIKQSDEFFKLCKLAITTGFENVKAEDEDEDGEYTPMDLLTHTRAIDDLSPEQIKQLKRYM